MTVDSVQYLGPFQTTHLVVDGRRVPHVTIDLQPGGQVTFVLDERFALDVPVVDADRVGRFLADAIAVAKGYACHPRADEEAAPLDAFPRMTELGPVVSEAS